MAKFKKDPDAVLDYTFDWSDYLEPVGDTIVAVTAAVSPDGGVEVDRAEFTATTSTVWLKGGTPGITYDVTHHIETEAGREDDRTMFISVVQK